MGSSNARDSRGAGSARAATIAAVLLIGAGLGWLALRGAGPDDAGPDVARQQDDDVAAAPTIEVDIDEGAATPPGRASAAPAPEAADAVSTPDGEDPVSTSPATLIRGVVLEPTGAECKNAYVALGNTAALRFVRKGSDAPDEGVVKTDERGRFAIEAPAFPVQLTALGEGFASSRTLTLGRSTGEAGLIQLTLRRACAIRGHVWRPDGTTIPGRQVRLLMQNDERGEPVPMEAIYLETDGGGAFEAVGLDPGRWELIGIPPDNLLQQNKAEYMAGLVQGGVDLEPGDEAVVELGLPGEDAVRVRGRVTLGGEPVEGGTLQWILEGGNPTADQAIAAVGEDGKYASILSQPGAWYARLSGRGGHSEHIVDVPAGPEFTFDIQIPEGRIEGLVVDRDGAPVPRATVTLAIGAGAQPRGPMRGSDDRRSTDRLGAFTLNGLDPGTYTLGATSKRGGSGATFGVKVAGGQPTSGVTIVIAKDGKIEGQARGPGAGGAPVWFFDASGTVINPITETRTSKDGTFKSPGLAGGTYRVFAQVDEGVALSGPVTVPPPDGAEPPRPVILELGAGGTLVARIVTGGEPVRGHVVVRDADGRQLSGLRDRRNPFAWKRHPMDSTNRHFGPLPPGDYEVQGYVDGRPCPARTVTLVAGEVVQVELAAP